MNNLVSRLLPPCLLGSVLLAFMFSGCGVSAARLSSGAAPATTTSPATGHPARTPGSSMPTSSARLACQLQIILRPIDAILETLSCTVSQSASSETSFVLHYTPVNHNSPAELRAPVCQGSLSAGAGSCTVTFSSLPPQTLTPGTVSGFTEPSQYPLGPVVPRQVVGSRPTGTPLPMEPRSTAQLPLTTAAARA
jgi:hypothetical protein